MEKICKAAKKIQGAYFCTDKNLGSCKYADLIDERKKIFMCLKEKVDKI